MDVTAPRPQPGVAVHSAPQSTHTMNHVSSQPQEHVAAAPVPAPPQPIATAPDSAPEEIIDARGVATEVDSKESEIAAPATPPITQMPLPMGAIIGAVFVMIALSALTILIYLQSQ